MQTGGKGEMDEQAARTVSAMANQILRQTTVLDAHVQTAGLRVLPGLDVARLAAPHHFVPAANLHIDACQSTCA